MKKKMTVKAIVLMVFSALLFCMPVGALLAGGLTTLEVHAEDGDDLQEGEGDGLDQDEGAEESVSGNTVPEPECTCREKCSAEHTDQNCAVCKEDAGRCEYINPSVRIKINMPVGWHNDITKVHISAEDVAESGNFAVKSMQAKVTQNGSWMDITEDQYVEISEDCSVYVVVTDQKNRVYEKSRYIKCFDYTAPTLNAAVSDGMLSIRAQDTGSGVKAIYVNGHEFTDMVNGTLNVRLQQFDAGYQYFTIQAMDHVGNMSEVYKTKNPYYSDPEVEDSNKEEPDAQLPVSAQATLPSTATAQVTEYTKTDEEGNTVAEISFEEEKKAAMREADTSAEEPVQDTKEKEKGKEFYTIRTDSAKVFYLIIDKDGDEEMVYFLTEINENDLLNVTSELSETLPKNSAVLESAIPVSETALPEKDMAAEEPEEVTESETDVEEEKETTEESEENPALAYIILGIAAVAVIGGAYYFKVLRKRDEDFLDEEDDEEEDEEVYDDEEEESGNSEDDFFENREDE